MESAIKHTDFKEQTGDKDNAKEFMEQRSAVEDELYELPKGIYHTKAKVREMYGHQIVIFNGNINTERTVLYLHGGAYVGEIDKPHIAFCDKLAKKANATVFAPIYPLAPNHTCMETYELVENLYELILKFEKPITIMGDSAGGGLSAAFSEYLGENDLPESEHLVLISPWVDVSMSGDYGKYEDRDPMIGIDGGREMGKAWAGDLDTKDYRVSPMFGNVDKLPQTTIFIGTHEVLYPDVIKFYDKLEENGVDVELNVGEGMYHVYLYFRLLPNQKRHLTELSKLYLNKF